MIGIILLKDIGVLMQNTVSKEVMTKIYQAIEQDGIQKVVVGAVIDMGDKNPLLLKRTADDFMGELVELPSGTVDSGETLEEALVREVKEETNLTITKITKFISTFDYLSGSGKKTRQVNFKVQILDKNIKLSSEHESYYTYAVDSTRYCQLTISPETKKVILKAFDMM